MKTSGLFTLHELRIPCRLGEPTYIIPFGDIHRDSPNFSKNTWKASVARFRAISKSAWFIGMGDYIDSMSTSERQAMARAELHESTGNDLETLANNKVAQLSKELDFMRGRMIGLINGNHYFSFQSGINSDQKLAERLGCKYLGVSSFIRLSFVPYDGTNRMTKTLDIWAHHGAGGSRLVGGSINRVSQMAEFADADIFLMGHDHKRGIMPGNDRLVLVKTSRSGVKLQHRQQWFARTGSYILAYSDGMVSYNADACRAPSNLGHVEFEVTPLRVRWTEDGKERSEFNLQVRGTA